MTFEGDGPRPTFLDGRPPQLPASPRSIAELQNVRHRDLMTFSTRLGRLGQRQRDRLFANLSMLFAGGAVGGFFGFYAFTSTKPSPSGHAEALYIALLGAALALALCCGCASRCIREEREESVRAIKEDIDTLLEAYKIEDVDRK
ncbi:MAG TPA: hypothetical protein VIC06_06785 [Solirubrobacteraceae bacterium]|jgi:hypothetical protein